jgi:hypothetical protein
MVLSAVFIFRVHVRGPPLEKISARLLVGSSAAVVREHVTSSFSFRRHLDLSSADDRRNKHNPDRTATIFSNHHNNATDRLKSIDVIQDNAWFVPPELVTNPRYITVAARCA